MQVGPQRLFNRKNLYRFARFLYTEKDGYVYYQLLCVQNLALRKRTTKGVEVSCCVLGELYEYFTGNAIYIGDTYHPEHESEVLFRITKGIGPLVRAVIRDAPLRPLVTRENLHWAVRNLYHMNDTSGFKYMDPQLNMMHRARRCSEACINVADTYLI